MAILTRPRFLPQQRLDLEDINALLAALRTDSKLYNKQLISSNNLIFKGFSVTGIGLKQATVAMADATLVIPQNSNDFSWFTAAPAEANIIIPDADLVDGVRNYVEIVLQTENNTPLTKAFWDPEANSGLGSEFNQIVATITDLSVKTVVSTGGFSGSVDRLPLCIIDTDGSGNIKIILDRRNLFGRLGTPVNINNRYSWGARLEPAYTMQLTGTVGTFVAGEQVTIGTETATVLTGGTTSITFLAPSGINFFPTNAVTGGTSGATATVDTISESFIGADKNLKTQKDINDALMSEIALVKGTSYWYQDPQISLAGIVKSLESVLTQGTATAAFSWDGSALKITDDNVSPANDTLGYIRILGRTGNLSLTREDGTGGTSTLAIADGEVLYVKIPTSGSRTFSDLGSGDTNFQVASIGSYQSADTTYWLAYREGTRLYIRGYGELEPGEVINIGDPELEDILAQIAANQDIETQDRNIKLIEGGTWSLDETASLTPVTPVDNNSTSGSTGNQTLKNGSAQVALPFTVANTTDISTIAINLAKAGSPTGTLSFELRNLSGLVVGSLIKSSNALTISTFNVSPSLQTFTFGAGTIPAGTYALVPVFTSGTDVVVYGIYSGNPSISILSSADGGVSYTSVTSTLYLVISGNEIGSGISAVTLSADAYIQVPGLLRARNRIAAQTINLPNATSVAYVDINRSGVTPAALTVVVADEDTITNNVNRVVIARRGDSGVVVGTSSTRLSAGESKKLYSGLSDQNKQFIGITDDSEASPVYSSAFNISNGDSLVTAVGKLDTEVKNANDDIATKEPTITAATSADYYRGDKTFQPLDNAAVGLSNVTDDSQLKRSADDFTTFSEKTTSVDDDVILIEDSEDSGIKKYIKKSNLGISGGSSHDTIFARNGSGQAMPISTLITISGWSSVLNPLGEFNPSTGIFTAATAGPREFILSISIGDLYGNGDRLIRIYDVTNSATVVSGYKPYTVAGSGVEMMHAIAVVDCDIGHQVRFEAFQDSTGALALSAVADRNNLIIKKV